MKMASLPCGWSRTSPSGQGDVITSVFMMRPSSFYDAGKSRQSVMSGGNVMADQI